MENAQLTLADLASIHQLLSAAASRSAFKGIEEMKSVSDIHEKLTRFLVAAQQAQQQAEQVQQPAEPEQPQTQGDQNA